MPKREVPRTQRAWEGEQVSVKEIAERCLEAIDDAAHMGATRKSHVIEAIEAAIREAAKPLVEALERIGSAIDNAAAHWDREGMGGMQVPFHGDFGQATPNVRSRLRWHGRNINAALAAWRDGK